MAGVDLEFDRDRIPRSLKQAGRTDRTGFQSAGLERNSPFHDMIFKFSKLLHAEGLAVEKEFYSLAISIHFDRSHFTCFVIPVDVYIVPEPSLGLPGFRVLFSNQACLLIVNVGRCFNGLRRQVHERLAATVEAKARILPDLLRERMADGRKTLVFSTRLRILDALDAEADLQRQGLRIDGQVPTDARRAIEDRFQNDPEIRLFLGQTRACSEALTLDAADTVVIAEADWSPQANEQALRRALRVNTDHPIEVVWLVVKGTLDEARMEVLARKRGDFNAVMDGGAVLEEALASEALAPMPGC